jgi:hypothetical protein
VGVLDTVKATNDDFVHDLSFVSSIQHLRHALALNETRDKFEIEHCVFPGSTRGSTAQDQRTLVEAWFIGAHWDIGGSTPNDGLSLYPFHWIISDAKAYGLALGFVEPLGAMRNMGNPLHLIFPRDSLSHAPSEAHQFVTTNGIKYTLHDFRSVHKDKILASAYTVKIHSPSIGVILFKRKPREPFLDGELVGYNPSSRFLLIISERSLF